MGKIENGTVTQSEESMTSDDSLPAFLTTGIDPSRLFRITINISLIIAPYRIPSFRAEVRMLYEKTGRRLCDTERRIYYNDDALPFPSL